MINNRLSKEQYVKGMGVRQLNDIAEDNEDVMSGWSKFSIEARKIEIECRREWIVKIQAGIRKLEEMQ